MRLITLFVAASLVAACAAGQSGQSSSTSVPTTGAVTSPTETTASTLTEPVESTSSTTTPTTTLLGTPAPSWLGTRIVPLDENGDGISQPTPPELLDRQFHTVDLLPPPIDDMFQSTIGPVPSDVLARSTWHPECPVGVDELSYVTVSFYGFDGVFHTGELIVNEAWAAQIVEIFKLLHENRYPIEQMQVVTVEMDDALPTGDGNNTSSFTCRTAVGEGSWSMHASGLAVDINPFHNPYEKGELILPELATAYADRDQNLPGMLFQDSVAVVAFESIGWTWGGNWRTLKDYMHFSSNGR